MSKSRPKMVGTVLPQDSLRGLRGGTAAVPSRRVYAPSPTREPDLKLLAAAGLDLFRKGLAFDGVLPTHQEPRHPAVTPNLLSIPENDPVHSESIARDSQLVVVVGGALNSRGEPGRSVSNRIAKAIQIYWQVMLAFAEEKVPSLCYVVPTGGETNDEGIVGMEAIRNALVGTGVSPHHIIMDCTATSIIDNALQLVNILHHLRIDLVHVVTSEFHLPRVKLCYQQLFREVADLSVQIVYHGAPDGLTSSELAKEAAAEQALMRTTQPELKGAIQRLNAHRKAAAASTSRRAVANGQKPSASRRPTLESAV